MTDTTDLKILKFSALKTKEEELLKLKIFPKPVYNSEFLPDQAIFQGYNNYIFLTSKILEQKEKLIQFINTVIKINGIMYFPLRLPSDREIKEELLLLLKEAEIKITQKLTISWDSDVKTKKFSDKFYSNLPRRWQERIHFVRAFFNVPISHVTYRPPQKTAPYFPLFVPPEKTAKAFVHLHNAPAYAFYYFALCYHVAFSTGLFGQTQINKAVMGTSEARALLPRDLTFDKLITISKNYPHKISKSSKKLVFEFDLNVLNALHSYTSGENKKKSQRINIPIKLLPHVFKAESFGKNGLAFFLLIIFGYRCRNPKVRYKPSTIVKLAHINTKMGTAYTVTAINKPLLYLKSFGVLDFKETTKENLKSDKTIEINLFPLKYFKL